MPAPQDLGIGWYTSNSSSQKSQENQTFILSYISSSRATPGYMRLSHTNKPNEAEPGHRNLIWRTKNQSDGVVWGLGGRMHLLVGLGTDGPL